MPTSAAMPASSWQHRLSLGAFYLASVAFAYQAGLRHAVLSPSSVPTSVDDINWPQRRLEPLERCWLEKRAGEAAETALLRFQAQLYYDDKIVPVSSFGIGRSPINRAQIRRLIGPDASYQPYYDQVFPVTQRAITRVALIRFLGRAMSRIGNKAAATAHAAGRPVRCLEWDGKWYLHLYGTCSNATWSFSLMKHTPSVDERGRSIRGDLNEITEQHPQFVGAFDIIFCSQVFEHVSRPHVSAGGLAALLAPGGFLIWTAPFIEPTHGVPFDYFRYTISGAMKLFEDVGLTPWLTEKSGDGLLTSAFLQGYSIAEMNSTIGQERLEATLSMPVTRRTIDEMERGGAKPETLSEKIYLSSFLLARAPTIDEEPGHPRFFWKRVEQPMARAGATRANQ